MFSNQTITVSLSYERKRANIIPFHKIYKRVQIIIINQDTPESEQSEQDYNDIKLLSKSIIILIIDVYNYVRLCQLSQGLYMIMTFIASLHKISMLT
jgi:hypothetical protein